MSYHTIYCILYTVYCILYTIYYILNTIYVSYHTIYCILYTIYCILYTVYYILCTIYCMLYTVYYILYTVYCILYTILYTVYCILFIYTEKNAHRRTIMTRQSSPINTLFQLQKKKNDRPTDRPSLHTGDDYMKPSAKTTRRIYTLFLTHPRGRGRPNPRFKVFRENSTRGACIISYYILDTIYWILDTGYYIWIIINKVIPLYAVSENINGKHYEALPLRPNVKTHHWVGWVGSAISRDWFNIAKIQICILRRAPTGLHLPRSVAGCVRAQRAPPLSIQIARLPVGFPNPSHASPLPRGSER